MSEKLKMRRQENDEAKKIEKMREREDERITKRVWKWEWMFEKTFAIINQSTLYEFLRSVNKMLNAVENNAELQD